MIHDVPGLDTCFCYRVHVFPGGCDQLRAMIVGGRSLAWHMEDLARQLGIEPEDAFLDRMRHSRKMTVWRRHFPSDHDPMRLEVMEFLDVGGMCDLLQYVRDSGRLTPEEAKDWHFFLDGFMIMQLRKGDVCGIANLLFDTK